MTNKPNDAPETGRRLKSIIEYVRDCQVRIGKGEIMDLQGLDKNVLDVCNAIAKLPKDEGQALEDQMSQLIDSLELLAHMLKEQQEKFGIAAGGQIMDMLLYIKFLSGFVFVIALMLLLSWVVKKAGGVGGALLQKSEKRLRVVEFLQLDHKRRLVLVRRDNREHLLVLGPESEAVVETGIIAEGDDEHVVSFARDQRNVKL